MRSQSSRKRRCILLQIGAEGIGLASRFEFLPSLYGSAETDSGSAVSLGLYGSESPSRIVRDALGLPSLRSA